MVSFPTDNSKVTVVMWLYYTNVVKETEENVLEGDLSCRISWEQFCHTLGSACISSIQSLSRVQLFATPWTAARQASLSITNSQSPSKPMSIESVMPSSHLILGRPLLLLPSILPSISVFSNESALCIRWLKDWSFSFSISPSNEHPGLISFRMDWLDLLAVQGTLKSLLQHHSPKASILQRSALFIVQLSHAYMTTGKTIFLTRQAFVDKVMSLLFNMLSSLVITYLKINGDFLGGSVTKTLSSQCRGRGSCPGWGTRSHMLQPRSKTPQAIPKTWKPNK